MTQYDRIFQVAEFGDLKTLQQLFFEVKNSKRKEIKDSQEQTLLHVASYGGFTEMVVFLLEQGVKINSRDKTGSTALHCAAVRSHFAVCQFLLDNKADPTIRTTNGTSVLHYLARHRNVPSNLFEQILSFVDVNVVDNYGETPLHQACSRGSLTSAQFLLDHKALVNPINNIQETPLSKAKQIAHPELCQLLIEKGAESGDVLKNAHFQAFFETVPDEEPLTPKAALGTSSSERLTSSAKAMLRPLKINTKLINAKRKDSVTSPDETTQIDSLGLSSAEDDSDSVLSNSLNSSGHTVISPQTLQSSHNNVNVSGDSPTHSPRTPKTALRKHLSRHSSSGDLEKTISVRKERSESMCTNPPSNTSLSVSPSFRIRSPTVIRHNKSFDSKESPLSGNRTTSPRITLKRQKEFVDTNELPNELGDILIAVDYCETYPNLLKYSSGFNEEPCTPLALELSIECFKKYFSQREHLQALISITDEGKSEQVMIITMLKESRDDDKREILLWTPSGELIFVRELKAINPTTITTFVKSISSQIEWLGSKSKISVTMIPDKICLEMKDDLLTYEKSDPLKQKCFSFGVIYAKQGQKTEQEVLGNENGSEKFDEFLQFIGQKIELNGWTGYRGDLDVSGTTTGTHSIYTSWQQLEIMFHVSTLLPFRPNDPQQMARKSRIGNDIVAIVFQEGGPCEFRIVSQFLRVYLIVSPIDINGTTHYRLACCYKEGVSSFGPTISEYQIFPKGDFLRSFLLSKVVNGHISVLRSPHLSDKLVRRPREMALRDLVNKYKMKKLVVQ